jgi:hypothetical protein
LLDVALPACVVCEGPGVLPPLLTTQLRLPAPLRAALLHAGRVSRELGQTCSSPPASQALDGCFSSSDGGASTASSPAPLRAAGKYEIFMPAGHFPVTDLDAVRCRPVVGPLNLLPAHDVLPSCPQVSSSSSPPVAPTPQERGKRKRA